MSNAQLIASLSLMMSCIPRPEPSIRISVEKKLPEYLSGASAWHNLGFNVTLNDSCNTCAVLITIDREHGLRDRTGFDGLADRSSNRIIIDGQWDGFALIAITAHEVGHIILDTGRHTPTGERAIMSARTAEWTAQPSDYKLACETIGICYEP